MIIDSGITCSSTKDKAQSFHVIMIGKSKDLLGQFEIRESLTCADKGFIVTPAGIQELKSWKLLENLMDTVDWASKVDP
jgi:hypothetical protein